MGVVVGLWWEFGGLCNWEVDTFFFFATSSLRDFFLFRDGGSCAKIRGEVSDPRSRHHALCGKSRVSPFLCIYLTDMIEWKNGRILLERVNMFIGRFLPYVHVKGNCTNKTDKKNYCFQFHHLSTVRWPSWVQKSNKIRRKRNKIIFNLPGNSVRSFHPGPSSSAA